MGYSHYWNSNLTEEQVGMLAEKVQLVIDASEVRICGWDGTGDPIVTAQEICFNGCRDDSISCETFRIVPHATGFEGTKTGRQPYDAVVVATLIMAANMFPDRFSLSSDGDVGDWEEGRDLAARATGQMWHIPGEI